MIELRPRESVILAVDFPALYVWYRDVLGFRVTRLFEGEYHYANLETSTGIQVGIGDAKEMGVEPGDRKAAAVILQLEVDDVAALFEWVKTHGGSVSFGPSFDAAGKFWFGAFLDPEGNAWWVVDANCP